MKHFEGARPSTGSAAPVDRNAIRRAVRRPKDLSADHADTDGNGWTDLWLRRRMTSNSEWVEWHSFAADGTPGSSALVPASAEVHLFTNRALWGVVQGEDGDPRWWSMSCLLPCSGNEGTLP